MFELEPWYVELAATARDVAASVADRAADADESLTADPVMRDALRESGLPALCVTAADGGRTDTIDPLAITVVREALMGTSAHLDGLFGMQGIGSYAVSRGGDPALRARWLPRVATLDVIAALALTEPDVGSDLKAITTTISAEGSEHGGELRVSGHKSFITNAGAADFYTVLGKEGDGYSLVFVPASAPGVSVDVGPRLIAPHVIGEVRFDDVVVPADHRLGLPGEAFTLVLDTLATFRVSVAGAGVGLAQAALNEAVAYATQREQFGQALVDTGPIPHLIGQSRAEVEAARVLTYKAATLAGRDGRGALDMSSMAKVMATETAGNVADRAVQILGRFGLVAGSTAERLYRNARPMRIYEGGNEVLLGQVAKRLAKPYRGS